MNLKTLGCSVWYTSEKAIGSLLLSLAILLFAQYTHLLRCIRSAVCFMFFYVCVFLWTIPIILQVFLWAVSSYLRVLLLFGPLLGSSRFLSLCPCLPLLFSLCMFIFIYIYPVFDRRWLYKESQAEEEHNPHMKTCQSWAEGWEKTRGATESWLAPSNSHLKRECICVRPTFCLSCTAKMSASTKPPLLAW